MAEWVFEHSIYTIARRRDAWAYWSDLRNHASMEPGIERIELDGPFATGTTGRTITTDYVQEWKLTEVIDGRRFVVTGLTPDGTGALSFAWAFEDEGRGTRMTHRVSATGPQVEEHLEALLQMEAGAPVGMARLAAVLDRFAPEHGRSG
jgi:hypothetical protein